MDDNVTGLPDIQSDVKRLGPWFHNLHLPDGTQTAPDHFLGDFPAFKWRAIAGAIPDDLSGWEALDIGCNAGYYSFELAKRGARVLAIDHDPHYLEQASWAARRFGLQHLVSFREMEVYDIARIDRTFDLIWFMGVFYHLRYPLFCLDIVAQKLKGLMVFQTLTMHGDEVLLDTSGCDIDHRDAMCEVGWPKMAFIEHELAGDPTNWWAPNHACIEAMLRSCGMRILSRPDHEVYVCERDHEKPSPGERWDSAEFLAAISLLGGKD
ncbi:MAG TPA: TIGR04290 family methyltransferase [Planctomycetota bacterium]|nr:TIGR04290 family methyltransferase [Planctomycetota bacterium]